MRSPDSSPRATCCRCLSVSASGARCAPIAAWACASTGAAAGDGPDIGLIHTVVSEYTSAEASSVLRWRARCHHAIPELEQLATENKLSHRTQTHQSVYPAAQEARQTISAENSPTTALAGTARKLKRTNHRALSRSRRAACPDSSRTQATIHISPWDQRQNPRICRAFLDAIAITS